MIGAVPAGGPAPEQALPFAQPRVLFCVDDNFRCQAVTRRSGLALQRPAVITPFLTGAEVEDVLITAADPRALAPSGSEVTVPRGCDRLDVGVSLGVVMRPEGGGILGFVVALDFLRADVPGHQTYLARSFPTHKVVSATVAEQVDPRARIQLRIDGEVRQDSQLDQMIADVEMLVATITAHHPADGAVILTGSPGGRPADADARYLEAGSVVEGSITGLGSVAAEVVEE